MGDNNQFFEMSEMEQILEVIAGNPKSLRVDVSRVDFEKGLYGQLKETYPGIDFEFTGSLKGVFMKDPTTDKLLSMYQKNENHPKDNRNLRDSSTAAYLREAVWEHGERSSSNYHKLVLTPSKIEATYGGFKPDYFNELEEIASTFERRSHSPFTLHVSGKKD